MRIHCLDFLPSCSHRLWLSLLLPPVQVCTCTHTRDTPNRTEIPLISPSCKSLHNSLMCINHGSAQKRFCPLPQLLFLSLSHKIVYCLTVQSFTFPDFSFLGFFEISPRCEEHFKTSSFHKWYPFLYIPILPSQLHEPKFQIDKD